MVTKTADELRRLTRQILEAAGAVPDQAEIVAEHLVLANLRGVDSHGVWHIEGYVRAIRDGHIRVAAEPKIARETPASALVQGDWAFGHVVGRFAMQTAIEKPGTRVCQSSPWFKPTTSADWGTTRKWPRPRAWSRWSGPGGQGAEKPAAVPFGGRKPLFHTNPIAMGLPHGKPSPRHHRFRHLGHRRCQSDQRLQPKSAASPRFRRGQGRESQPPTPGSSWTGAPTCPSAATRAMP